MSCHGFGQRAAGELLQERGHRVPSQRLEPDDCAVALPVPPGVEQLGARQRQHEQRDVADQRRQARQQVEEDRLTPLDVVDQHDQWRLLGPPAQQMPRGPADLLRARSGGRHAEHRSEHVRELRRIGLIADGGGQAGARLGGAGRVRDGRSVAHELGDGPVRDALTVGQAAAAEDPSAPVARGDELVREPALPDPRLANDCHELRPALPHAPDEGGLQLGQLHRAPLEARAAPRGGRLERRGDVEQSVRRNRIEPALKQERRHRLDGDLPARQP